jgi:hypothetical protein
LFHIQVDFKDGQKYIEIKNQQLVDLQTTFASITHVIIDEFSMMSQTMLGKIDGRLRQAKCKPDSLFGGLSIILTGDPAQLLPVGGAPLYDKRRNNQLSIAGFEAYQQFNVVVRLEQVMRQLNLENDPEQQKFLELLPRARNGENTVDDWLLLCTRQPTILNLPLFEDAYRLFTLRTKVNAYNVIKLNTIVEPKLKLVAFNTSTKCRNANADNFRGLENIIYCSINARVVLTSNIWTSKCLVNSSYGIIRDILFFESKLVDALPDVIIIEVFKYSGPQFFNDVDRKNWIPFRPLKVFSQYHNGYRLQYSINLAYAQTIHKSQGK